MDLFEFFRGLLPGESKKKRSSRAKRSKSAKRKVVRTTERESIVAAGSRASTRPLGSTGSIQQEADGAPQARNSGSAEAGASRPKSGVFKVAKEKTKKAKDGKVVARLRPPIENGDLAELSVRLSAIVDAPAQVRDLARQRTTYAATAVSQLQQAVGTANYQAAAHTAAALMVESAFLGDPILKKAQEVLSLAPFLEKAAKARKMGDALDLASNLEALQEEFDTLVQERADALARVGDTLLKTLASKDFLAVASIAEAVARDACVVGSARGSSSVEETADDRSLSAQANQEKWVVIDKQVLQLNSALGAGQYQFAVELAKMVSTGAGVMGDPTMAKAVELTKGCRQLMEAFRSQNVPLVEKMCATLSKQAGMFNSPLMARAEQLAGHVTQWQTATEGQDYAKATQLASAMARTTALLVDPTIRRASLLAGDVPRVEISLKRKDFAGALATLDAALK